MTFDQRLYALHRVNTSTGEVIRFERDSHPAMPRATIEGVAAGARKSKMVGLDEGWEIQVLRDVRAELEIEGVPDRIIHIVEAMAKGREWGLCDPMYMANRVAVKFGWGDGHSNFGKDWEMSGRPDQTLIIEFASEIHWSYQTVFGEINLSPMGVLSRVLGGLEAGARNSLVAKLAELPRG